VSILGNCRDKPYVEALSSQVNVLTRLDQMLEIRTMASRDFGFAQHLTEMVEWNYSVSDFERLLYYEPQGCFVAEHNREPLGIVTTTTYEKLAWVGSLIVLEPHRGRGVGSELMKHAIRYLQTKGVETIRLDAVPKAMPLYKRLGFQEEYDSLRFIGTGQKMAYRKVSKMENEDLESVVLLDTRFFGANRERILRKVHKDFQELCFVSSINGKLIGYIMAKRGLNEIKFGPWICDPKHVDIAEELLRAVLNEEKGMKVWVGVPSGNEKSVKILKEHGFVEQPKSIRMYRGKRDYVGLIKGVFGIGSPEKG